MKNVFLYLVFGLVVFLLFFNIISLVSAAKMTGSFTITGEAVRQAEQSEQLRKSEQINNISLHQDLKHEDNLFTSIINFFKKIKDFFAK